MFGDIIAGGILILVALVIGVVASKLKGNLLSISFIGVSCLVAASVPTLALTHFQNRSGSDASFLPMIIPALFGIMVAISLASWAVFKFRAR